uniref:Immunoglobulin V-set domain-containing protein n=1 Tax=Sinocyclocheilus anshuiensis TaxID=1608454 RepID=A0A671R6J9_9TELE
NQTQTLIFLIIPISEKNLIAEISVFVQTGASVQLDIQTQQLPEFDLLSWMNDKLESIVRYNSDSKIVKLHNPYKDRVDFNDTTFSLTLKNMQKTDSGLYTARISGLINKDFVAYRISVIDAVAAPALTVNSNCSDSCTVNFTCRAHELTIYSSYQNNSCSPEEVTLQQNYTLILFCSEETIICNHSNPVSWKENRSNITQLCVNNGISPNTHTNNAQEMQKINSDCNTYDIPHRVQAQTEDETGDNRPNTTYCTVGQYQEQKIPPETEKTIYSVVKKKTNKKPPAISSDDT